MEDLSHWLEGLVVAVIRMVEPRRMVNAEQVERRADTHGSKSMPGYLVSGLGAAIV